MTAHAGAAVSHLVGLWADAQGILHLAQRAPGGLLVVTTADLAPFAWTVSPPSTGECELEDLAGPGPVRYLATAKSMAAFAELSKNREPADEVLRPLEHQWLLANQARMFAGVRYTDLRRCQVAVRLQEPEEEGADARIEAIALWFSGDAAPVLLTLPEPTDAAERALLKQFNDLIQVRDPDILEGHGLHNHALLHLNARSRRFRLPRAWARFDGEPKFRSSRQRVAERWLDFQRCDIPGRSVFDTWLAIQLYDVSARELTSYELDDVADHFGLLDESAPVPADEDPLIDELRRIRGIADRLLPTYVAQAQNFPLLLQEAALRGTGQKVEMLLLEKYYQARASLPDFSSVATYEGGYTKSFGEGVYRNVLHFDVASLYPSLLLAAGRNPAADHLGVFIPLLDELRTYRLRYKQLARETPDPELRQEYNARQASFKILINSFYGYLGFAGARFADGELAAEVTRQGRDLLQALIEAFTEAGAQVLEADTDGIYIAASDAHWAAPETLLAEVERVLPAGIHLEFDGRYPAMFCYKAKNYALYDGERITVKGSALRSRGIEPFLKELTEQLIAWLLGLDDESPETRVNRLASQLEDASLPIERVAKGEHLSMSPAAYAKKMEQGGKPRRASLEVALRLNPPPRMGAKVFYYLRPKQKGQTSDWQRAEALENYDAVEAPYDPKYYLKRLNDWRKRYQGYYDPNARPNQDELGLE